MQTKVRTYLLFYSTFIKENKLILFAWSLTQRAALNLFIS